MIVCQQNQFHIQLILVNLKDIKGIIKERKILYEHGIDQTENKLISSKTLKKVDLSLMPNYLRENSKKYINWLDI